MTDRLFLTGEEIADAAGGRYVGKIPARDICIDHVVIDDRQVSAGTLFVPIVGERFDGHSFIERAKAAGAPLVLSDRPLDTLIAHVRVKDTLGALQSIAALWMEKLDPWSVGVTGSAGKTTTKEMIASVLSQCMPVKKTQGNLNNQTGVPQTIFALGPECRGAVIEMGMNHFGEIDRLAAMVRPDVGVITNIGTAHIEHLGSREGILRAKCEMLPHIKPSGFALVNGDDEYLCRIASEEPNVRTFGFEKVNDYRAALVRDLGIKGTDVVLESAQGRRLNVHIPAPGKYMIYAALAAFACGIEAGASDDQIADGISAYQPVGSRMRVIDTGRVLLLDDTYNANPSAMREALAILAQTSGRRVAILGDMLELGAESADLHREVGREAGKEADMVIGVGAESRELIEEAAGTGTTARWFSDQTVLLEELNTLCLPGDSILIKGSRGMHLENTVQKLEEIFGPVPVKDQESQS